jgi:hypothetical protein
MNTFLLLWETGFDIIIVDCMLFKILAKCNESMPFQVAMHKIGISDSNPDPEIFVRLQILCCSCGSRIFAGERGNLPCKESYNNLNNE